PSENEQVGRPAVITLRDALSHFVDFRVSVTRRKLTFERRKLDERIHLLEGLASILDKIKEVIEIVRKSDGRKDAAEKIRTRFKLTEVQAYFIVDLRIYQLSKTSIDEVEAELAEKSKRRAEIDRLLKSEKLILGLVSTDLKRIDEEFGDDRRCTIVSNFTEEKIEEEEYIEEEEVYAVVTRDGWLKRMRLSSDPGNARLREGDSFLFVQAASTRDSLSIFTSHGNQFVMKVFELSPTTGFGEPVQKMFKFQDGESIVSVLLSKTAPKEGGTEIFVFSHEGVGFRTSADLHTETKKSGRRIAKPATGDSISGVRAVEKDELLLITRDGYALRLKTKDVPILSGAGKGVILQKMSRGDKLVAACFVDPKSTVLVKVSKGAEKEMKASEVARGERSRRGDKVIARGTPVLGVVEMNGKERVT
ncbi:MAG: hypothetical protein IT290_00600, partial [Deltaproteobacteria bacterium]|nr:hypothetical protein [Deltaproteobacteria bacterium]